MSNSNKEYLLDFEKPLFELEQKLDEMRTINMTAVDVDLSDQIQALEQRVDELRTSIYKNLTRWQRVQIARHPLRPYTLDYISSLTTNFEELRGDRSYKDDPAIIGGFARFLGSEYGSKDRTIMILGHQKGRDTSSRKHRRFGMPNPEGYRKALRLMKLAARFGKPVVTLLDTPGAFPGLEAEERGQAEAIARNLLEMARLPVPIIVVVIGEGASGGALGVGVGDRILMLENSWYSVISPESCSSILWRSWDHKEDAALALKLTAPDLTRLGLVDTIVEEPIGGAHRNPAMTTQAVGRSIAAALDELGDSSDTDLITRRRAKFDAMGAYDTSGNGKAHSTSEAPNKVATSD
ncbi:MAG: acetyl-CoA carboxylase carboxyltransferase subunit alpha [Rhodothermales bacterium]|nr:acetyl-CoA carboxylase carboxyltransferase subunit alpha [Rhodothermales bacterium]